jgi:hypothetical protein
MPGVGGLAFVRAGILAQRRFDDPMFRVGDDPARTGNGLVQGPFSFVSFLLSKQKKRKSPDWDGGLHWPALGPKNSGWLVKS